MRLSVCLIVRDEESRLPACLDSLVGLADEVCVTDTGSRDGTLELARSRGARVARLPWSDDFAAARNASLQLAEGDWALVIDADERLATSASVARAAVERFAALHPGHVGRVLLENLEHDRVRARARVSRLVPLDGRHTFVGRVHEQIRLAGEHGLREPRRADVDLELHHLGYDPADVRGRSKLARNAGLLERELEDGPRDGYLWYQLGRTRALAGQWQQALEALEQALAHCPDDAPWGIAALEEGAYALRSLGASEQALELISRVEAAWSQRPDTCFLVALLAMDTGDLERARRGFRRCLELGPRESGATESSPAAATYAPAYNLGVMSEVLGQREEALEHFHLALALHPEHEPSQEALRRLGAG
jgi:tetratricopeptide (TPR) repeat protein